MHNYLRKKTKKDSPLTDTVNIITRDDCRKVIYKKSSYYNYHILNWFPDLFQDYNPLKEEVFFKNKTINLLPWEFFPFKMLIDKL